MLDGEKYDLIVIGGGAAGYFTAIRASEIHPGIKTLILEAGSSVLRKVKISGGGRCNVTHQCFEPKTLIQNYPRGERNLLNAFFQFQPENMLDWLHQHGVKTKVEKDGRIFPVTDSSQTIIDCFVSLALKNKIELQKKSRVDLVRKKDPETFVIKTAQAEYQTRNLVIATGSMTSGHDLARSLGHTITSIAPSLFTLKSKHPLIKDLAGTAKDDVLVELRFGKKKYQQRDPLLITHWGFSGPAILKLSSKAARDFLETKYRGEILINWLPDFDSQKVIEILELEKKNSQNKQAINSKLFPLTKKLWHRLLEIQGLVKKSWQEIKNQELIELAHFLQKGKYQFDGKGEFKEEFVTCGGVSLKEVHPSTFESKLHSGLFFAGEVLDVDGLTGGFNFQHAWTSGNLAAKGASYLLRTPQQSKPH